MNFFFLRMVLALAVFAVFSLTANAQAPYPNQGIRFIVPYAPGGLPDTVARIVGQHLQERIGQSVVIENRAGGGSVLAVNALMGAPADGYTFLVTDGGILSTNPALFKQLSYDPKDIVPLALLGRAPMFLATHPDLPVSNLREFIDYVKARPGEINYGSSGVGSIHHLSMEALKAALQLNMTHIPYRGTGQSVPALLGGHVQVLFAAYPSLAGAAESKKVKLLAQNERAAGSKRRTCPQSQRSYQISIWQPSSGSSRAPACRRLPSTRSPPRRSRLPIHRWQRSNSARPASSLPAGTPMHSGGH
jgi:tripartite-type tricarboxylate transporter receptor subunit TctC